MLPSMVVDHISQREGVCCPPSLAKCRMGAERVALFVAKQAEGEVERVIFQCQWDAPSEFLPYGGRELLHFCSRCVYCRWVPAGATALLEGDIDHAPPVSSPGHG